MLFFHRGAVAEERGLGPGNFVNLMSLRGQMLGLYGQRRTRRMRDNRRRRNRKKIRRRRMRQHR
jgi:hypothetical protein